jgi:hypothetical protein
VTLVGTVRSVVATTTLLLLAGAVAAAGSGPESGTHVTLEGHGGTSAVAITALLVEGEALLARLDTEHAQAAFERAAALAHEPEVEVSLVRTYLQAGEYRRALAFGAHAAGAHPDYVAATALYAWLLHVGGQEDFARRRLDAATALVPHDPVLLQARDELVKPWPLAHARLVQAPVRFAPYASDLPAAACTCASGTLLGDGMHAVVPSVALTSNPEARVGPIWVRNGLGNTVRASIEQRLQIGASDATILRLEQSLPRPAGLQAVTQAPFAGSPGYAVEYTATTHSTAPAWPLIRLGFFARSSALPDVLAPLGIRSPTGPRGGPVFDNAGRVVGVALQDSHGEDRILPIALLPAIHAVAFDRAVDGVPSPAMAMDEIYERSLLLTLQVITGHP